jgi:hypothetical protein
MTDYLTELFATCRTGYLSVFNTRTKRTDWFPVQNLERAAAHMGAVAADDNIYFMWTLQKEALGTGPREGRERHCPARLHVRRGREGSRARRPCSNDLLPASWEEVVTLLQDEGFPLPTAIRHSGNGAYFDWLLEAPWVFANDGERKEAAALSDKFQRLVIALAKKRAWHLDNVGDLARITRMPSTLNHKTSPAKPVKLLEFHPERRYGLEEIRELVVKLELKLGTSKPPKRKSTPQVATPASDNSKSETSKPRFAAIVSGCAWAEWLVENASQIPEPDWHAAAGILGRCEDGQAAFHELSRQDTRYDHDEAHQKLERALTEAGPRTCENIADSLGFSGCKTCPFVPSSDDRSNSSGSGSEVPKTT